MMKPIQVHDRQRRHKMQVLLDLLLIILVTFGIAVDMTNSPSAASRWRLFTYYTIQTNLMVMLVSIWAVLAERFGKAYHFIRSGVTVSILVTALGYHFLLSGNDHLTGMDLAANMILHYIVPLLALVTYILYMRLYTLRWWACLGWLIYPILYIGGTLLRGSMTAAYPYWFLNPTQSYPKGVGSIAQLGIYCGGFAVAYIIVGIGLSLVNNLKRDRVI